MITAAYAMLWLALVAYIIHLIYGEDGHAAGGTTADESRHVPGTCEVPGTLQAIFRAVVHAGRGATADESRNVPGTCEVPGTLQAIFIAPTVVTAASWGALTAGLVGRGLAAGHWPLTNRYEFALCFAWAILVVYLLLEAKWRERQGGAFVLAVALLVATYALLRPAEEQAIRPLLPALRSIWLQVHVLSAAFGYGACGVAAGLGLMRLVAPQIRRASGSSGLEEVGSSDQDKLAPVVIERAIERVVSWGFPWLTLGILTGAIWAQNAWGRYWGWDPKETWALITWLWYLLILHVWGLRGWRGRRLAILALAGFGIVFFTFAGLPWLVRTVRLESLHGF